MTTHRVTTATADRIDGAVERYRELLESADRPGQARLIEAVAPEPGEVPELDENLFGPAPVAAEATAAGLEQLTTGFERRREVAGASLTRDAAATLLGVTRQTVLDHLQAGHLVGLRDGKRWLLPAWQFEADSERGFLPGIAELSARFPGGVVSLTRWVTTPNVDFDARPPRDVMAAGRADDVAAAAAGLTSAGW